MTTGGLISTGASMGKILTYSNMVSKIEQCDESLREEDGGREREEDRRGGGEGGLT
jgi:hypothetical protein